MLAGMDVTELTQPDRYPLSANYDPGWVVGLDMGPHPLWQLEDLLSDLALRPGVKVLDLGCGKGATSVFLARERDVDVVAFDLWVKEDELRSNLEAQGVSDRVTPVNGDVRDLPFEDAEFDAISVSTPSSTSAPTCDGRAMGCSLSNHVDTLAVTSTVIDAKPRTQFSRTRAITATTAIAPSREPTETTSRIPATVSWNDAPLEIAPRREASLTNRPRIVRTET